MGSAQLTNAKSFKLFGEKMQFPKIIISSGGRSALAARLIGMCFVLLLASSLMLSAAMVRVIKTGNNSTAVNNNTKTVIVDAGHGGFDGGAVVDDIMEKDINLKIANSLSIMLKAAGFNVINTRTDDSSTESDPTATISARKKSDLKNRLELAKANPDAVYISIHLNKYPSASCKGAQMFCSPKIENATLLAENIKSSVVSLIQPDNHRAVKKGTRDTFLLYYSPIPTVIVECGFMSNPTELEMLINEDYQNKMAFAVFSGILSYYNT